MLSLTNLYMCVCLWVGAYMYTPLFPPPKKNTLAGPSIWEPAQAARNPSHQGAPASVFFNIDTSYEHTTKYKSISIHNARCASCNSINAHKEENSLSHPTFLFDMF
ncbi:hypothetical protein AMTRI_Chr07g30520 [Amborella trichopoda]